MPVPKVKGQYYNHIYTPYNSYTIFFFKLDLVFFQKKTRGILFKGVAYVWWKIVFVGDQPTIFFGWTSTVTAWIELSRELNRIVNIYFLNIPWFTHYMFVFYMTWVLSSFVCVSFSSMIGKLIVSLFLVLLWGYNVGMPWLCNFFFKFL